MDMPAIEAPHVVILSDQIIRPQQLADYSILKVCLETGARNYNDIKNATLQQAGGSGLGKLNLLDGLGDDFFDSDIEVVNDPEADMMSVNLKGSGETGPVEATSGPPTPRSHWSQASSDLPSVGSLPDISELLKFMENKSSSPITDGGKKKLRRGGKGDKIMLRPSTMSSPSLTLSSSSSSCLSQVFCQPEDGVVIENLIYDVCDQKQNIEERLRVSDRRRKLIVKRRENAEAQQREDAVQLHRLQEEVKELQKAVIRQQVRLRENAALIEILRGDEKEAEEIHDREEKLLQKYNRKLFEVRKILE